MSREKIIIPLAAILISLGLAPAVSIPNLAWQDEGHVLVNQVAAEHVPGEMPKFFRNAVDRLAYLGPEPDRWRRVSEYTLKESQEPDHFIKLEVLDVDLDTLRSRYDFYRMLYERRASPHARKGVHPDSLLPENVGLLPYITIEGYERLKVAFREYRQLQASGGDTELVEGNVILYAGWLGHYVADAAEPHHTTIHYDGWQGPNPDGYPGRGAHGRVEGDFVRNSGVGSNEIGEGMAPAERLQDPFAGFLDFIYETHQLVERTYQLDKAGGFTGAGTEEGRVSALERLTAASQMLLDLWYTAWLTSID
jgi:hypothetical protein